MTDKPPMMRDPRVMEFCLSRQAAEGIQATAEARERYKQSLGPYCECIAEHCPPHVRPHMMKELFLDNIPLGVIAIAFRATEEELEPIRSMPPLVEKSDGYIERLQMNAQMNARERYRAYRRTSHWQETRRAKLREADYRCSICNQDNTQLDVHHRTYDNLGCERPGDLIVICNDCHNLFHKNRRLAS